MSNYRIIAGLLCLVAIIIAWILAPPSKIRSRFLSEFLIGESVSARLLRFAFTLAAVIFGYGIAENFDADPVRSVVGLAAAVALVALAWIEMTADPLTDIASSYDQSDDIVDEDSVDLPSPVTIRRQAWWLHPAAAQSFFGLVTAYLSMGIRSSMSSVQAITAGAQLATVGWMVVVTLYATCARFGVPRPHHVSLVLLDRRPASAAELCRAAEWPAVIAVTLAIAFGP